MLISNKPIKEGKSVTNLYQFIPLHNSPVFQFPPCFHKENALSLDH